MKKCRKCDNFLDKDELKKYDGLCRKCVIKDIKKHVEEIEKPSLDKHRKPSNVIYVVNRPQPGQVKGDWAVRGHGKIYSSHRTKIKAIENAKKIAKKRKATIMIQNINGTFSKAIKSKR